MTTNPIIDRDLAAAIASTRFGLGARPGEIAAARTDPRGFLAQQIRPAGGDQPADTGARSETRMRAFLAYRAQEKRDKADGGGRSPASRADHRMLNHEEAADFLARTQLAAASPAGFRERWTLFWVNHFTVAGFKKGVKPFVGPFEIEAIRPHVFGNFADMLVASSHHPAMLFYLDQARSIGPNSAAGRARAAAGKPAGLNENLAREIMELHTLGVETGYTQADVTEFARALTGWSVAEDDDPALTPGAFRFREAAHEPGPRTVLGKTYPAGGEDQGLAILADFAASPHTAGHLAAKIARHFIADDPPPALVDRLADAYRKSGGHLETVARALIDSPEAWSPEPLKFKTPYDFLVSSWRALGSMPSDDRELAVTLIGMGQPPMRAPSPKGWPEEARVWCAPDALIKRMNWSDAFARTFAAGAAPLTVAENALGARLSPRAAQAIARAESRPEAVAILLMSPEFQRR